MKTKTQIVIQFVLLTLFQRSQCSYSPLEFKQGSDSLLKKAMEFRRAMPKLNRALVRMQVQPRLAATLASISALESYEELKDHNQDLSAETVDYMKQVFPRLKKDLETWEYSAMSSVKQQLDQYTNYIIQTIDNSIKNLAQTPDMVNSLYLPVKNKMLDLTRAREKVFFDVVPRLKIAMNDTLIHCINMTHDEYWDEDFPNGPFDFEQQYHSGAYISRVYNLTVMSKILNDTTHPLTKAAQILYDREKTFGEPRDQSLIWEKDYPKTTNTGELHLQRIRQQMTQVLDEKQKIYTNKNPNVQLSSLKLRVMLDTSPPRYQLIKKTIPPEYPWREILDEVEDRIRDGRRLALIYDIQRPIYTAYSIVIEDVKDIQRDMQFLLPLLQYDNYLALCLLDAALLLQLVILAFGINRRRRQSAYVEKQIKRRYRN